MYRYGFPKFMRYGIAKFIFFAAMTIIFVFAIGNIVMYLWNWILPDAIGAKELTFWKALGLFVLTRILFGGFKSRGSAKGRRRNNRWKEKWMNMTDEERKEFKQSWKSKWGGMSHEEKKAMKEKWKQDFKDSWK